MLPIALRRSVVHPEVVAPGSGGAPRLTIDDVQRARALLRCSDETSRRDGLDAIGRWGNRLPDPDAARMVLRAATLAYPVVDAHPADPALRFGGVLCRWPRSVPVDEVEAAYLVSGERIRRVLLHLLALRRDTAGVAALDHLLGPDGPVELVPLPAGELLSPVLDVVSAPDLAPALVHLTARAGWTWHATDLLVELVEGDRLDGAATDRIVDALWPLVDALVSACDRTWGRRCPDGADGRPERHRLRSIASLMCAIGSDRSSRLLRRMLASADPRVSAMALGAALHLDDPVAPERVHLIARDPAARAELYDALLSSQSLPLLPARWRDGTARAEAELVRWLAGETALGAAPDEIEHVGELKVGEHPDDGSMHLFRFRYRVPHWSSARGWLVGAAGPFRCDATDVEDVEPFASSVYAAEDDDDLDGHLDAILDELGAWPGHDGD